MMGEEIHMGRYVGGSAAKSNAGAMLFFALTGVVLVAVFIFLGAKGERDSKPLPSKPMISGVQTGVWDRIPVECKTEFAPLAGECFEKLSDAEKQVIACEHEDGPGPCFWTDPTNRHIWYVAGPR